MLTFHILILIFLVSNSVCQHAVWSSISTIDAGPTPIPLLELTNIMLEVVNNELTISFFQSLQQQSSDLIDQDLVTTSLFGLCGERQLSHSRVNVRSLPFPVYPSDCAKQIELMHVVPAIYPANIFHYLVDFLIPLHVTVNMTAPKTTSLMVLTCPVLQLLPLKFQSWVNLFTDNFYTINTLPERIFVERMIVGLDSKFRRCKGSGSKHNGKQNLEEHCQEIIHSFKQRILHLESGTSKSNSTMVSIFDRAPHNRKILGLETVQFRKKLETMLTDKVVLRVYKPHTLTLDEQYNVIQQSDVVVLVHGAANVWSIFASQSTVVVELYPPGCNNFVYKQLARNLGTGHVGHFVSTSHISHYNRKTAKRLANADYPNATLFKEPKRFPFLARLVNVNLPVTWLADLINLGLDKHYERLNNEKCSKHNKLT
ncbi:hypothetical protein RCL1_001475 [Eukaryota sp. TZLM3-RCL]